MAYDTAFGASLLFFVTPAPEGIGRRELQYRAREQAAVSSVSRLLTRAVLYRRSKVTGLRETHASGRVGDCISVTARWMNRSRAARLSGEGPVCPHPERLARGQVELVGDRRRRDGVALQNLPADGVVLSVETDAGSALDDDRYRKRCDGPRVIQPNDLFVEPGAVGVDRWRYGNTAGSAAAAAHSESNRRCPRQPASGRGNGDVRRTQSGRARSHE